MIHLSLSFGSRPLCGTTDSAMVATQTPIEELRADICSDCLAVWDDAILEFIIEPIGLVGLSARVEFDGLVIATALFNNLDHKHPHQTLRAARQWLRERGM
jgi:hypothetical protein